LKKNKIKKVYKILARILTIIFYWVIFPLFLLWFSFKVQIGKLNIPNLLAYGIGFIVVVYGLYWYIGAGIAQHKSGVKISRNYKSASFLSRLFQLNPPDKLITTGIYAKSRNPMFFGYTVILIGMGISLRSISILVIFVPAFIVFDLIWIKLEEKNIREKFGNKYSNYKKNTPFFIPNHLF